MSPCEAGAKRIMRTFLNSGSFDERKRRREPPYLLMHESSKLNHMNVLTAL